MNQAMLFIVSLCGYMFLLYALFRGKKSALYPAVTVSAITALSLPAALAGVLASYYQAVYAGGFAAFALGALWLLKPEKRRHRQWQPRRTRARQIEQLARLYPLLVFAVLAIAFFPLFTGRFLHAYDDFTHWGRIARIISTEYRLPVEADQLSHSAYPPGSALFIGYASSMLGASHGVWTYAQLVMNLSFWVSLLAIGKSALHQAVLTLFVLLFANYNINPDLLSVDNLLSGAAVAALMVFAADDESSGADFLALGLIMSALVLIKNSGALFFVLIAAYAVCLYVRREEEFSPWMLALLLPLALLVVWHLHVGAAFSGVSNHQVSLTYYQQVLSEKTSADVLLILRRFLTLLVQPMQNRVLLFALAYPAIYAVLRRQDLLQDLRHVLIFSLVLFIVYEIGILLMYIFSMPMAEFIAQNGRDYNRYNNTLTAVLASLLLTLIFSIRFPDDEEEHDAARHITSALSVAAIVLVTFATYTSYRIILSVDHRISLHETAYHFSQMSDRLSAIPADSQSIVFLSEADSKEDQRHIARYYLNSADVELVHDRDEALALYDMEPWRYLIDLHEGTIQEPTQTRGVELFAESYTNRYDNLLSSVGYKENTRYSASNAKDVSCRGWDITGYIPAHSGDILRLHNVVWSPTDENDARGGVMWYGRDMNYLDRSAFVSEASLAAWDPVYDEAGNIVQLTVPENISAETHYLRITAQDIRHLSVITVNEEIR